MAMKPYWLRRETEPDPSTPKNALRYTGRVEIYRSAFSGPDPFEADADKTVLVAIVDSFEVAQKMVALANDQYMIDETTER